MNLLDRLERLLLPAVDRFFERRPRPRPSAELLRACRLVAHRGVYDNRRVFENTLAAFDAARKEGVWGIEFDIRWTRDLHPVVVHDPGLERVFEIPRRVEGATLAELRALCPLIPSLADVLARYGGRLHLMAELKAGPGPDPRRRDRILGAHFAGLAPGADYHLLALDPALYREIRFAPPAAFLPVARLNFPRLSRGAAAGGCGGVAGHYALVGRAAIRRLHAAGVKVGTGYPRSRSCLFREIGRGVDWIFSNHAAAMQRLIDRLSP